MPENRERLSLTISPDLVRRLDAVCDARGESRSAIVELIIASELPKHEQFVKSMENPVLRAVFQTLTSSPRLLESIGRLVGDEMSLEEAKGIKQEAIRQAERGRARRGAGRPKTVNGGVEPC